MNESSFQTNHSTAGPAEGRKPLWVNRPYEISSTEGGPVTIKAHLMTVIKVL
jgi:hypothetical protein